MHIGELKALISRYQEAKDNGQLQNASEATMRAWIDELLFVFGWDVKKLVNGNYLINGDYGKRKENRYHCCSIA